MTESPAGDLGAVRPPMRAGPCERQRVEQHGLCSLQFSAGDMTIIHKAQYNAHRRRHDYHSQGTCTSVVTLRRLGVLFGPAAQAGRKRRLGADPAAAAAAAAVAPTSGRGARAAVGGLTVPASPCLSKRARTAALTSEELAVQKAKQEVRRKPNPIQPDQTGIRESTMASHRYREASCAAREQREKRPHHSQNNPIPHAWLDGPLVNHEGDFSYT